jgi:outer membrane protein, multidrug efflux system
MVQLAVPVLRLKGVARLKRARTLWVCLVAAALGGCALKSPPTHATVVTDALPKDTSIPPAWKAGPQAGIVVDDWLKSFGDPALEATVAEAIANNIDLREASERVAIARQAVIVVGSKLLPQIGIQGGARTTAHQGEESHASAAYAGVAWELDVWGRLRARRAAAEAGFEATALDFAYARQSLAALAAKGWYLATETYQLLELAEESVRVHSTLLDLVTIRRTAGKVSNLDLVEARADLDTAHSEVEAARQTYGEARRALEVLLGRYPAAEIETAAMYPPLPTPPGAGIPASLLERRPDIAAAEREVLAAFRRHEAAKLALLPDFSFSLVGGRLDDQILSALKVNPWLASAGIGVFIPIFEGGALRAKIRIATAEQSEALARYGSIALTAFREVEDALANDDLLAKRLPFEQRSLSDRDAAVRIAIEQYRAGRIDQLSVSQLQAAAIAAEAAVVKLRSGQLTNRIRLHLALGGSFDAIPAAQLPVR